MDRIRARIQKKIANHSQNMQNSAVSLAEQTKKNLLKMFDQYENNQSIVSDPVEITKYNNKFQDLDYLNQAKIKISELTLTNDRLKIELLESNKNILAIKQMLDKQRSRNMQQEDRLTVKFKKQLQENKSNFQTKIEKNLKYIDQLLQEKAKFNQQTQTFLLQRKKLQKTLMELKDKYKIEYKSKLQAFEASEKQKRIKWQQTKIIELKQNTIKGMQPQLNSIITRSRNQIKSVEERCEKQKVQHRQQCYREFQKKILQFRQQAFREHEAEKQKLRVQYSMKRKQQFEKMQIQFANDRQKMRQTYKSDIQDLQYKRKNEQQQFMKKNRSQYDDHLEQMKRIREVYQDRIKILEGSREKYLQSQKQKLSIKYQNEYKQLFQKFKVQQRKKLKEAFVKLQQEFNKRQEDYIHKMATESQQYEKDIQIKYEAKRKDERKLYEQTIRKLKRDVGVLEEKLQKQNKTSGDVSKQKDYYQTQYMELKINYDQSIQQHKQNQLKVKQLQRQLDSIRLNFAKDLENKIQIQKAIKNKQLDSLRKLIQKQEQDRLLLDRNRQNEINQKDKKWAQDILQLQERAAKVLEKKSLEIQNLKKQVKKHEQLSKGYQNMLQKQRQQLMVYLSK